MLPVDEGLIHAWLDGQLPDADAQRVARLVETDPAWNAAATEARGLIAGTSRVLSALDHVPSVGAGRVHGAGEAAGPSAAPRVWWRAPWLRAAAVLVFAAGTATAVWQNMPGGAESVLEPVAPSVLAPVQGATGVTADSVGEQARGAQPPESQRTAAPPATQGAAAPPATADAAAPPPVAGAERQAKAVAEGVARRTTTDAMQTRARDDTARREVGAVAAAAPPLSLVEQGVVGARPTTAQLAVDPRLDGCWARIDSTGTMVNFATASAELAFAPTSVLTMRFTGPTVTDVVLSADSNQRAAAGLAGRSGVGGGRGGGRAANSRTLLPDRSEPPRRDLVGPFNAATRMLPDSSFVAEFLDAQGRTEMAFTVAGDTLRGTMRRSAGDLRAPATPVVAVRVTCPQ